jgi:NAD(P)-dependent dehydrogenase (short-subunit alcohol dehydrogenase family)
LPPAFARGLSGYFTSKVAQNKIIEFLAVENPGIFFCAVHPGVVETKIFRDAGLDKQNMPVDSGTYHLQGLDFEPTNEYFQSEPSCPLSRLAFTTKDQVFEWEDGLGELGR